jgi:hypothetical protein
MCALFTSSIFVKAVQNLFIVSSGKHAVLRSANVDGGLKFKETEGKGVPGHEINVTKSVNGVGLW